MIDDIKQMLFQRKLKNLTKKQNELEKISSDNQNDLDNKVLKMQQLNSELENIDINLNKINFQYQQDLNVQEIFENTMFGFSKIQKQNLLIDESQKNFKENLQLEQNKIQKTKDIQDSISQICENINKFILQRQKIENQINMSSFKQLDKEEQKEQIIQNEKQIQVNQKEIQDLEKSNAQIKKEIDYFKKNIDDQNQNLNNFCEIINNEYKKMNEFKDKLNSLLKQQQKLKQQQDQLQYNKNVINKTVTQKLQQLAKIKGSNNISLLFQIVDQCQKNEKIGKIDFLINCIDFPQSMNIPIEALFFKDLFTIIVEKEEDVKYLLDLNKKHNGGQIKILPLNWVVKNKISSNSTIINSSFSFQKEDAVRIKDYINLKQECAFDKRKMDLLLEQVFGNSIYVKDKQNALKLAKEENLNTVTQEGEIFYAGAYMGKIGRFQIKNSKLNLFQEITDLNKKKIEVKNQDSAQQKQKIAQEIKNYSELIHKSQSQISQIEANYNQIKLSIKNKQNQLINLTKTLFNNKSLIAVKNEINSDMNKYSLNKQQQNSNNISYQKLQSKMEKINKQILQQNQQKESLQNQLQILLDHKQEEQQKLSQSFIHQKNQIQNSKQKYEDINHDQIVQNKKLNKKKNKLQENKNKLQIEIEELQQTQHKFQGQLQGLTIQILDLNNEIQKLQPSGENNYEEFRTKQLIDQLKKLIQKTKNAFSEKDQVAFHKLKDINKKEKEFKNQLDTIDEQKQTLLKCFGILTRFC